MRRFLPIILLLVTSPAWATFTKVQEVISASTCFAGTTTCTVTVTSTGTGHLLAIAMINTNAVSKTISSVTAGACSGAWAHGANTAGSNANNSSTDIEYCLSSVSGVTSITLTASATMANPSFVDVIEYSFTGTISYDTSNNINNTTNTLRGGVDLTALAGTNDLLYQTIAPSNASTTVSAISGAYTSVADVGLKFGFGVAINTATGTAPTWTFSQNSQSCGSALAIKEVSAGGTTRRRAAVINQ